MATIPEALKNVYTALGGSAADVANIDKNPEMINKVADQIAAGGGGGGGSSLPPVTADDNGDVLTVVEGVWNKAAPSGGASALLVTCTYHDGEPPYCTLDKNYNQISGALASGTVILFKFATGDLTAYSTEIIIGESGGFYNVFAKYLIPNVSENSPFSADSATGVLTLGGETPK